MLYYALLKIAYSAFFGGYFITVPFFYSAPNPKASPSIGICAQILATAEYSASWLDFILRQATPNILVLFWCLPLYPCAHPNRSLPIDASIVDSPALLSTARGYI